MAISTIEISGYRSIKYIKIDVKRMAAFIGPNGSGKSNILSALNYFYRNLTGAWDEVGIFDANNVFRNEARIKVVYDIKNILKIIQHNQKLDNEEYETYYKKIQGISTNDAIVLELVKRKDRSAIWNVDYNTRQIVTSLFPVYFVDARKIELTDWSTLWEQVGDLVKLPYKSSENIRARIEEMVEEADGNLTGKITILRNILRNKGIDVKNATSRQLGERIAEIMIGGQIFQYGNRSLQEYSNGTNAYNYVGLLIEILSLIKQYKLKEPIIIIDEPEISLHLGLIDPLMDIVFDAAREIQFFLSTHSSRCVRKLLEREETDYDIYHIALIERYSQIKKVRNLSTEDSRERVMITDDYTNSCFAKMVLNVEGETEIEVFKNKYLKELFPDLKMVEVLRGMSNRVVHNLTAPSKMNYHTPGLAVIDMDKMLEKKENANQFCFRELKDYDTRREYYYYDKKRNILYLHKRILNMCEKCKFSYKLPFFSCDDINFECLLELIREYCKNYHISVWKTTIEGALITAMNMELFEEFMFEEFGRTELKQDYLEKVKVYLAKFGRNNKLNYIRLIFSGKSDYLLTKRQIRSQNKNIHKDLYQTMASIGKTSGWVSGWLEYYFLRKAGIEKEKEAFKKFSAYVSVKENRDRIRSGFASDFAELYELLTEIEKKMT